MTGCGHDRARDLAEQVARASRGKLVAFLAARSGDLAAAEDALSEAFASALAAWPQTGCPENPEAWLLTAARRKLIDQFRGGRETPSSDELEQLAGAVAEAAEDHLPDRRLALLFACTHPAIDAAVRAPLMLQVVLGLEAAQIASAFLTSPAAMAQRLVRAKAKIRDAGIPFTIPDRKELPERVQAVLDSIYACFSEGWSDPAGVDSTRRELAAEAIFLGRLLIELLPDEPEARGLLALMLYSEARRRARRTPDGAFVPLAQQDRTLWDAAMIAEAEAALVSAQRIARIGRYQLEAAIQSAHVEGARTGTVPWTAILTLYNALVELTASPSHPSIELSPLPRSKVPLPDSPPSTPSAVTPVSTPISPIGPSAPIFSPVPETMTPHTTPINSPLAWNATPHSANTWRAAVINYLGKSQHVADAVAAGFRRFRKIGV